MSRAEPWLLELDAEKAGRIAAGSVRCMFSGLRILARHPDDGFVADTVLYWESDAMRHAAQARRYRARMEVL